LTEIRIGLTGNTADAPLGAGQLEGAVASTVVLTVPKQHADAGVYKTLADVKGKTISLASTGSGNEIMLDRGLRSVGLSNKTSI
jgi:TRAP-type uncharacterized transport system substrate-binding protein